MESNEISVHESRIFSVLKKANRWMTNREIADAANVAGRTARHHTKRLVNLGIVDQAELFPAHQFKIATKADKRNIGYLKRLEAACTIFGDKGAQNA